MCKNKSNPLTPQVLKKIQPLQAQNLYTQIYLFFMKTAFLWHLLKMFATEAWTQIPPPHLLGPKYIFPSPQIILPPLTSIKWLLTYYT